MKLTTRGAEALLEPSRSKWLRSEQRIDAGPEGFSLTVFPRFEPEEPEGRSVSSSRIIRETRVQRAAATIVEAVRKSVQHRSDARLVFVSTDVRCGDVCVRLASWSVALSTLVDSAIDASREGDIVRVSVSDLGNGDTLWQVQDMVAGLSKDAVLESVSSSTGLGFVRDVVSDHRGLLHVESSARAGTTVRLFLPRRDPDEGHPSRRGCLWDNGTGRADK